MGYAILNTLNPISKIEEKNDKIILHCLYENNVTILRTLIDNMDNVDKYVVFTDSNDVDILTSKIKELTSFTLEEIRTSTNVNMTNTEVKFILNPLLHPRKSFKIPKGVTLYPKIQYYNDSMDEVYLYFYIENITESRKRKLQKIIKNKCQH